MRIITDRERCTGSGQCVLVEPDVFDQNERDGRVVLHTDRPDPGYLDAVRDAVMHCPAGALSLDEPDEDQGA